MAHINAIGDASSPFYLCPYDNVGLFLVSQPQFCWWFFALFRWARWAQCTNVIDLGKKQQHCFLDSSTTPHLMQQYGVNCVIDTSRRMVVVFFSWRNSWWVRTHESLTISQYFTKLKRFGRNWETIALWFNDLWLCSLLYGAYSYEICDVHSRGFE